MAVSLRFYPSSGSPSMSKKHPVIAVTGSSGAGTTTVKRAFEHIFFREKINAAVIEGDSFHSLSRVDFKAAVKKAEAEGNFSFSHFGPQANHFDKLAELFKTYGETGGGKKRYYSHSDEEAAQHNKRLNTSLNPGEFTPWEDVPAGSDVLFYEDRHGRRFQARRPRQRRGADRQPRVDPEDPPRRRRARLLGRRHRRHHPAPHAGLRELCHPAVLAHRHQLPARVDRRHVQPLHLARHPDAGRELHRDPLPRPEGRGLPVPAQHDLQLVHVAPKHHRGAGRQDGLRHGTDPG